MSAANIDLVRRANDALGRGDFDAMIEISHPDVELDWSRRLLDSEVIRGHDEMRRFFDEIADIFDEVSFEENEIADYGDNVLVVSTAHFRGRTSGVEVKARGANIWTIRDGKLARFRFYQSKQDALADLESEAAGPLRADPR